MNKTLRPIAMYNLIADFRVTTALAKGDAAAADALVTLLNMALARLPRHEQVAVLAKMHEFIGYDAFEEVEHG